MRLTKLLYLLLIFTIGCRTSENKGKQLTAPGKHFPNLLAHKKYQTENLIGLSPRQADYTLVRYKENMGRWVGNTINFVDNEHFVSAYEAWCGNDCFTTVYGRYYFEDNLTVYFYTDSITYHGDCEAPVKHIKSQPPQIQYIVAASADSLQLNYRPLEKALR
uniref:hypothetical protein n=1 Tax=Pedobacter schmidteae TaxID=2201271 RepID=UPI0013CF1418|nr:hypothetical protein [Pedobacter schmidteae]